MFSLFFVQTVSADCNGARSRWDSALEQFRQAEAELNAALQQWAIAREAHEPVSKKWRLHCFSRDRAGCSEAQREWDKSVANTDEKLNHVKQVMQRWVNAKRAQQAAIREWKRACF